MATDDSDDWVPTPLYMYITNHGYKGRLGKLEHHFMQGGKLENTKVWRSKPPYRFGQPVAFDAKMDGVQLKISCSIGQLLFTKRGRAWGYKTLKQELAKVGLTESD